MITACDGEGTKALEGSYKCSAAAHNCDDLDDVAITPGGEVNVEPSQEVLE